MKRRTKIVCTIGPAVDGDGMIGQLLDAGMDVARLNFSHGSHEEHGRRIRIVRQEAAARNNPCAILLDTRGPEIRTGMLVGGESVLLEEGKEIVLTEEVLEGTADRVTQSCAGLADCVGPGTSILLDDGRVELSVVAVEGADGRDIRCVVRNSGMLGQRKSVNLPGTTVPLPEVTDQDKADLLFGIQQDVDFVALSFVRTADDVRRARAFLVEHGGGSISLIAKIESAQAIENFDEILEASDGIMVARGDLGVEVETARVPHMQKRIIRQCVRMSKPVITATQMLESMIANPRPTRAEVADIANAIYDGTDAVMLSGETANGAYPVQAVRMMAQVAEASERHYFEEHEPDRTRDRARVAMAVGIAAVTTAETVGASCIIAPTMSGRTTRLLSHLRPRVPVYAVTPFPRVMRQQQLNWGVKPLQGDVEGRMRDVVSHAQQAVVDAGLGTPGDVAVLTAGDPTTSPSIATGNGDGAPGVAATNVMYVVELR